MDRLSTYLTLLTGAVITGAIVIAAFAFGWYGLGPVILAVSVGFGLASPVACAISRRIKVQDPSFDHTRVERLKNAVPRSSAPEV